MVTAPLPAELICHPGLAVRLRAELPAAPDAVWPFLVDPDMTVRWSPIVPDRLLNSPGPALSREQPDQVPVACDVLVADQPRLLEHRWGDDTLRWELEPSDDATALTLTQRTSDEAMAASLAAGWTGCLDTLARLLNGEDARRIVGPESLEHGWNELNAYYSQQFGVESA